MPELLSKGKEFVYNHHLTVPFRPLEMDPDKGIGAPALDGNLIIHGDNNYRQDRCVGGLFGGLFRMCHKNK